MWLIKFSYSKKLSKIQIDQIILIKSLWLKKYLISPYSSKLFTIGINSAALSSKFAFENENNKDANTDFGTSLMLLILSHNN